MDSQIETFDEQTEAEIEIALDELRSVQFHDNTYTQAVEARDEVEVIIRALSKRLTKRVCAPGVGDKITKNGIVYVITIIEVTSTAMRVYMRSENDMLAEIERINKLL